MHSEFDEQNGTFSVEFSLFLDWQTRKTLSDDWQPEIHFDNAVKPVTKIAETEKCEIEESNHQKFRKMIRFKGTFVSTELTFNNFPFDYQVSPA